MMAQPRVITVFGSGRTKEGDAYYEAARELGAKLARSGFAVCTGGYGGVMEAVSRGAKETGGKTLGVTAQFFSRVRNRWIEEEIRVKTWRERLFMLIERGDGFILCPGGTGTLAELGVVWEMLNKGVMGMKPVIALGEFWRPIIELIREVESDPASPWGEQQRAIVHIAPDAEDAVSTLIAHFRSR
jgi:uncharacterized protein (TIGR00730 family)